MRSRKARRKGQEDAGARDERREAFLRKMGELYDRMMAQVGAEGESFDEIEEQALQMGKQASCELMSHRLSAEEQSVPGPIRCSRCGARLRLTAEPKERNLETCAGTVPYERQHAYCDRCRKSFSPSGPSTEDPKTGGIEPADSQDM